MLVWLISRCDEADCVLADSAAVEGVTVELCAAAASGSEVVDGLGV